MTTLYSKQGCAPCLLVKTLFQKKGIDYIEKDIEQPEIRDELFRKYQAISVPVTVFGDDFVVGPNMSEIMKRLPAAV